jgi:hypothetical protein
VLGIIVAIGLFMGPTLYVIREGIASPLEQLMIVTATFLLGLIVICVLYVIQKKHWLKEPDLPIQQERLDRLKKRFRKLLNVYVPIWLVIITIHVWLLLMGEN